MVELEELEAVFYDMLSEMQEAEQDAEQTQDSSGNSCGNARDTDNAQLFGEKMRSFTQIESLHADLVNIISTHLQLVMEQKILLHQLSLEMVGIGLEHKELLFTLQDVENRVDDVTKKMDGCGVEQNSKL